MPLSLTKATVNLHKKWSVHVIFMRVLDTFDHFLITVYLFVRYSHNLAPSSFALMGIFNRKQKSLIKPINCIEAALSRTFEGSIQKSE